MWSNSPVPVPAVGVQANLFVLDCGHYPSDCSSFTTGYGVMPDGKKHCYDCCGEMDREFMVREGKMVLYLTDREVTNWPGTLKFKCYHKREGRHNIARVRYDVWFNGPDEHGNMTGAKWWGVQYGNFTQICHCRRIKND